MQPPDNHVEVTVIGAGIKNEGTYRMSSDSVVIDLIEKAGGISPRAITTGIEWHQPLYEGLKLTIPTKDVFEQARSGTRPLTNNDLIRFRSYSRNENNNNDDDDDLININEADPRELQTLPGIGPVLSKRIIDYRKEHDGFDQLRQLEDVFGIGEVTYQELRAKVEVD